MYQYILTKRYLTTKVMPLLASVAVMLCTAMVLITWSVMGGFLRTFLESGRTMTGDVIIQWPNVGFSGYEDLIKKLEADPLIEAAAPMIEAYGLIALPDGESQTVMIRGVEGESYARVTEYERILWWRPLDKPLKKDVEREDPRLHPLRDADWGQILKNGLELSREDATGKRGPAIVPGIQLTGLNWRQKAGHYVPVVPSKRTTEGEWVDERMFLPRDTSLVLTVLPLDSKGAATLQPVTVQYPVANEFRSGVYELDSRVVLLRLDEAQRVLRMNKGRRVVGEVPEDGSPPATVEDPARVTHVLVRGKGDYSGLGTAEVLRKRCEEIYAEFAKTQVDPETGKLRVPDEMAISILTWEDLNRFMISAVQKETALVLTLFCIISGTAVFLVLAIFWAMVSEKTRDIGVLRSVGATRAGVAGLWLLYGAAIGLVGSVLGLTAAWLVVSNINEIHEWLGERFGLVIWDPKVYYFSEIPARVETAKAVIVFVGGVMSCVVGALVPAVRAARLRPVEALRFD